MRGIHVIHVPSSAGQRSAQSNRVFFIRRFRGPRSAL